jgi:hypothetical protein
MLAVDPSKHHGRKGVLQAEGVTMEPNRSKATGGHARAEKLNRLERREIAVRAATARWTTNLQACSRQHKNTWHPKRRFWQAAEKRPIVPLAS